MPDPSRILIIRFSSLGDIVLTSPATRALRHEYPDAYIAIAVKRMYEPLARLLPGVDDIVSFDASEGLGRLLTHIRDMRFDVMIDLHANPRSRILTGLGGVRQIVRYRKRRVARMGMVYGKALRIPARHTVDLYLDAMKNLGIVSTDRRPSLIIPSDTHETIRAHLHDAGIPEDQPIIGLAPGASSSTKQWPARYFAQIANRYAASHRILLLGGPHDRHAATAVIRGMTAPVIDWTGALDLSLLPAAITRCRLLVGNDSGPMHVASAVGTPVIGLFGPTHPRLGFAPIGDPARSLSLDLDCSPCSLHGEKPCWKKTHECLEAMSADYVSQAIDDILQTRTPHFTDIT